MLNLLLRFIWLNLWLGPWFTMIFLDKLRRKWKRPKREFVEALKNAQPGDIVLIRRNYSPPWGYWSHCGMVLDPEKGEMLHATNKKGVEKAFFTRFCCFYELAVIKPNVSEEQKEQAVRIAGQQIGKSFSLFGRSYRKEESPKKFCCAGLIWYAYKKGAGIDLGGGIWFVPDDLFVLPGASIIFWRRLNSHAPSRHWHRIVQFKTYGR